MRDVVIIPGAIGSVLSLSRSIKCGFPATKIFIISIDNPFHKVFESSKSVNGVLNISIKDPDTLLTNIFNWYQNIGFTVRPILYFASDFSCFLVNQNRDWFEKYFKLCLPSSYIIDSFNRKGVAENEAIKHGLLVPKTLPIIDYDALENVAINFDFPVIIKPASAFDKKGIDFKVRILDDRHKFKQEASSLLEKGANFICQEYIPGGDDNAIYYLFYRSKNREVFENIGVKQLQCPPGQGLMAIGRTSYNSEVSDVSKRFLESVGYDGIGGIEYKMHNGKYYFIEMSTRLEGFFLISDVSGVNLSCISYEDMNDLPTKRTEQTDNEFYVDLILLLRTRIRNKQYITALKETLRVLFKKNWHLNIFVFRDFKPFLLVLVDTIRGKIR